MVNFPVLHLIIELHGGTIYNIVCVFLCHALSAMPKNPKLMLVHVQEQQMK